MEKVKIGIIGIGNMGTAHAKNILEEKCPELELAAIADISPERREWAKENLPTVTIFDDALKMMDSGLVEAILIAVPHYDHPYYAKEGFARGLHVLSEKPAGVYTKQVREMNKAAEKSNVVFGMMFNQRTNHLFRKVHELVQSGVYGEMRRVNWIITDWYRTQYYYDSGAWRATWSGEGGGVLLNQCPHNLDLWQWICGMPKKITAKMKFGKWHDIEVEDDVTIFAEYENGATGVFITSTGDAPGTNRLEITLDRAKIVLERNKTLTVTELVTPISEYTYTSHEAFIKPDCNTFVPETDGLYEQHVGVLNAFASAILHGTPLVAGGEEGINGLMISNAAHLSAWLDREIELPFDEDLFYNELMKRVAVSRRKVDTGVHVSDTAGSYGNGGK